MKEKQLYNMSIPPKVYGKQPELATMPSDLFYDISGKSLDEAEANEEAKKIDKDLEVPMPEEAKLENIDFSNGDAKETVINKIKKSIRKSKKASKVKED
jgi:hypothetical protein